MSSIFAQIEPKSKRRKVSLDDDVEFVEESGKVVARTTPGLLQADGPVRSRSKFRSYSPPILPSENVDHDSSMDRRIETAEEGLMGLDWWVPNPSPSHYLNTSNDLSLTKKVSRRADEPSRAAHAAGDQPVASVPEVLLVEGTSQSFMWPKLHTGHSGVHYPAAGPSTHPISVFNNSLSQSSLDDMVPPSNPLPLREQVMRNRDPPVMRRPGSYQLNDRARISSTALAVPAWESLSRESRLRLKERIKPKPLPRRGERHSSPHAATRREDKKATKDDPPRPAHTMPLVSWYLGSVSAVQKRDIEFCDSLDWAVSDQGIKMILWREARESSPCQSIVEFNAKEDAKSVEVSGISICNCLLTQAQISEGKAQAAPVILVVNFHVSTIEKLQYVHGKGGYEHQLP